MSADGFVFSVGREWKRAKGDVARGLGGTGLIVLTAACAERALD